MNISVNGDTLILEDKVLDDESNTSYLGDVF